MRIALDIDGTISDHPDFFAVLSKTFRSTGHQIIVVTYRDPEREHETRRELTAWGVEFDDVVIAPTLESKGRLCADLSIDIFIDDQDECIVGVPETVLVLKVRNGGNFDFDSRQWLSTRRLTRMLR